MRRIDDLNKRHNASNKRITDRINEADDQLSRKIDDLDNRLAVLEAKVKDQET